MNNRTKSCFLALATLFIVAGCAQQESAPQDTSWANDNLKGKVKRVLEVTYEAQPQGDTYRKGPQTQVYILKSYTETGYLISERRYYSDSDQAIGGFNYIYDPDYNLLRIDSVDPDGGIISQSKVIERAGKVSIKLYEEYYGTGENAMLTSKTEMTWEGNLLMKAVSYNPEGEAVSTNAYTYDKKGNLTSFDVNMTKPQERYMKMISKYEEFDDKGNWTVMFKEFQNLPMKELIERQIEYYD